MVAESDTFTTFVVGLAGIGAAGFVGWTVANVIRLKDDLAKHKLHVANYYPKTTALESLTREVRNLSRVVYGIAGKLGIDVRDHE